MFSLHLFITTVTFPVSNSPWHITLFADYYRMWMSVFCGCRCCCITWSIPLSFLLLFRSPHFVDNVFYHYDDAHMANGADLAALTRSDWLKINNSLNNYIEKKKWRNSNEFIVQPVGWNLPAEFDHSFTCPIVIPVILLLFQFENHGIPYANSFQADIKFQQFFHGHMFN